MKKAAGSQQINGEQTCISYVENASSKCTPGKMFSFSTNQRNTIINTIIPKVVTFFVFQIILIYSFNLEGEKRNLPSHSSLSRSFSSCSCLGQDPRTQPRFSTWVAETQHLEPSATISQGVPWQEAGSGVQQGLVPRHSEVACGCSKQCLNFCTKYLNVQRCR